VQELGVGSDVTAAGRRACGTVRRVLAVISREDSTGRGLHAAGRRSLNASMALRIARGVPGARLLYRYAAAHPGVALARIWLLLPGDIWDSVSCPPMLRPVGVLKV